MKQIISASRRTDLPRWFLPQVIQWFEQGYVDVPNPVSRQLYHVDLAPDSVHSIVWWSKDYSLWLERAEFFDKFTSFFQFTINGERGHFLEPGLTASLDERIAQFHALVDLFGPDAVHWRFDPIVFWDGGTHNNLDKFEYIATQLQRCGINRMTFSFATWYGKCVKRAKMRGFAYYNPPVEAQAAILRKLANFCDELGIGMEACCNPCLETFNIDNVTLGRCVDGEKLSLLAGEPATTQRDTGQREHCQCTRSRDIGRYDLLCKHGCLYCYANPQL